MWLTVKKNKKKPYKNICLFILKMFVRKKILRQRILNILTRQSRYFCVD